MALGIRPRECTWMLSPLVVPDSFEIPWTRLRGSFVYEIFQAGILEHIAMPSARGSSCPRDQTCVSCVSCLAGRFFTHWPTREAQTETGVGSHSLLQGIFLTKGSNPCLLQTAGRFFTVSATRTKPTLKLNLTIIQRSKNNSIDLDSLLLCIISGDMEIPQQLLSFCENHFVK